MNAQYRFALLVAMLVAREKVAPRAFLGTGRGSASIAQRLEQEGTKDAPSQQ